MSIELAIAIAGAGIFVWWGYRRLRGRAGLPSIEVKPDLPVPFGYKTSWLAVRSEAVVDVCDSLAAVDKRFARANFKHCNWASGIGRIRANFMNREVFVSPPVEDWVFVVNWLPPDDRDTSKTREILRELSRRHDRAAYFASHRTVSLTTWALAERGEMKRYLYEVDGDTIENSGDIQPGEPPFLLTWDQASQMSAEDPENEEEYFDRVAGEEEVVQVALAWTLDPTTLDDYRFIGLGRIARPR